MRPVLVTFIRQKLSASSPRFFEALLGGRDFILKSVLELDVLFS